MEDFKVEDTDLYELLEIQPDSTISDIKKAYRKKALKCHPDKNPDNPDAVKLFHQLSKTLEILTDESARKAYDKVLKGRKEAALRHQHLDAKRKKFKEDLEAREKFVVNKTNDQQLQAEIERLRREGSRLLEEEIQNMKKKLREELNNPSAAEQNEFRIKIKWKASKSDSSNGGYDRDTLIRFLSKYGPVTGLVMSKKNGSALVEFTSRRAAEMAVDIEKGLAANPLHLEWVNGAPPGPRVQSSTIKPSDYESVVLTKLRQAEERKRLIAQMMAEDDET